jgi:hypothetical protein
MPQFVYKLEGYQDDDSILETDIDYEVEVGDTFTYHDTDYEITRRHLSFDNQITYYTCEAMGDIF